MAELVGGAFLSASFQLLFDRLASREVLDFIRGKRLNDGSLKKLKIILLSAKAVLNDAEEKQIRDPIVKDWLDELKEAVYDAEDLIDEIKTEALRFKLEGASGWITTQVSQLITSTTFNHIEVELEMKEILDRLEYIVKQKDVLGLKEGVGSRLTRRLPATSLVQVSDIYGRDVDKEAVVKLLLSDDVNGDRISVIPILGMGGVGKTTLAQLLYSDDRVNSHFKLKVWVYVSDEFDVIKITKTILETVTSKPCNIHDADQLQVNLKDALMGKKFLFVLDDVWSESYDQWDFLRKPFESGAYGSKIVVTTRNERVASMMGNVLAYHLQTISEEDCWRLFAKHAFSNAESDADLDFIRIGRQIVKKCKGLPLAVKSLGGLLRSELNPEEWEEILKSDIWELLDKSSDILPALWLSYYYLPPHLKRCFAYCSIFPKDHGFEKSTLILLWMAEDLLKPHKRKRIEQVGEEYFQDLVSRSLFQQSSSNQFLFTMHDLVNGLAQFVSGEFCLRLDDDDSHDCVSKTRHLSCLKREMDGLKIASFEAKGLRTFVTTNGGSAGWMLEEPLFIQRLRVLSLRSAHIYQLPDSIGNLKHLRYLDLSDTYIKELPDTICTLYNLQTLLLSRCVLLECLPTYMGSLINLRHLHISGTLIRKMPLGICDIKDLQILSDFVVSKEGGSSIAELRCHQNLHGSLCLRELQNVVNVGHVLEAEFKDKKYLKELDLKWNRLIQAYDSREEKEVLDALQPHTNLMRLSIDSYRGTSLPQWLGDSSFSNMVSVCLIKCENCFSLPPLGQLPSLQELKISALPRVVEIGAEFYSNGISTTKPFKSLRKLHFSYMPNLKEWLFIDGVGEGGPFPLLENLSLQACPRFNGDLPGHLPSLVTLNILGCEQLVALLPREQQMNVAFPSLRNLHIEDCPELESFPEGNHCYETLKICFCKKLELPRERCYSSLKKLYIMESCDPMKSLMLDSFPKLEELVLTGCYNLESIAISEARPHFLHESLRSMDLGNCPKFLWFPEQMRDLLPNLHYLRIFRCPEVELFSTSGLPSNLSNLNVDGCTKLFGNRRCWDLQVLTSLRSLSLADCRFSLDSFPDEGLFPETLTHLSLCYLPNLTSLSGNVFQQHLPSLESLWILDCSKLQCMPEGLPGSLVHLMIQGCPLLSQRCQREEGEDWPKICHIPAITIDWRTI